jgi:CSLREA domain-containing protein
MEAELKGDPMRSVRLPSVLLACLIIAAALALPSSAWAGVDTFTVTTSADPGDGSCDATCSLRDALDAADDGEPERDRININLAAFDNTIVLGSQLAYFTQEPLIISGGVFGAVISGNNAHPIFLLVGNPIGSDVVLDGLTLVSGSGGDGGAIGSSAVDLKITNSTIANSKASGVGGGILVGSGTLWLEDSTVRGNSTLDANDHGGGLYVSGGATATIRRSTISGNHAENADGGGIYNNGTLRMDSSTVSGNYTAGSTRGGGIFSNTGLLSIAGSTIAGNEARDGFGLAGGGIYTTGSAPEPAISNSIVADNTHQTIVGILSDDLRTADDTFQLGFSLVEQSLGGADVPFRETTPGSNLIGIDPQLGPLAQNGGFGATHVPAPSSPVVDKGSTIIPQDQRLLPRPFDIPHVPNSAAASADGSDIGAAELTLAEGPPVPLTPANPAAQTDPASRKRCKKKGAKKGALAAKKRRGCRNRKKGKR